MTAKSGASPTITTEEYARLARFRLALRTFLHFSEEAAAQAGLTGQHYQALLALRRRDEAATELRQAASGQARGWVQARAHLALGQLADLAGDRAAARREYDLAIPLADRDNDPATADAAKRYARTPFEGL